MRRGFKSSLVYVKRIDPIVFKSITGKAEYYSRSAQLKDSVEWAAYAGVFNDKLSTSVAIWLAPHADADRVSCFD
jgi:hypothetical protein